MAGYMDDRVRSTSPRDRSWRLGRQIAILALIVFMPLVSHAARAESDPWPSLRKELFQTREIAEEDGAIALYAPAQAEDAAVVPVSIRIPASFEDKARSITLLIDRNPAPVAAVVTLGAGFPTGGAIGERRIETRVRVDSFSKMRAILKTTDGKLHMATKFVAGAGGCSAAASKDADEALAGLGRIQVRLVAEPNRGADWREAVVMVRHPNFTGMQRDGRTGQFTPAWFVDRLEIERGGARVMSIDAGISISENPNIRFNFKTDGRDDVEVRASDTKGGRFSGGAAGS